jgi:universal stress protein A
MRRTETRLSGEDPKSAGPCSAREVICTKSSSYEDIEMKLFNRILCPIDFGPNSLAALEVARQLAEQCKGALTLLYVVPQPMEVGQPILIEPIAGIDPDERLKALAANKLNGTIPYEIEVAMGDAASEIIDAVGRHHCDAVVMATHGRTGLKHLLLGSVAERVVRESAVPVLTVRPKVD